MPECWWSSTNSTQWLSTVCEKPIWVLPQIVASKAFRQSQATQRCLSVESLSRRPEWEWGWSMSCSSTITTVFSGLKFRNLLRGVQGELRPIRHSNKGYQSLLSKHQIHMKIFANIQLSFLVKALGLSGKNTKRQMWQSLDSSIYLHFFLKDL